MGKTSGREPRDPDSGSPVHKMFLVRTDRRGSRHRGYHGPSYRGDVLHIAGRKRTGARSPVPVGDAVLMSADRLIQQDRRAFLRCPVLPCREECPPSAHPSHWVAESKAAPERWPRSSRNPKLFGALKHVPANAVELGECRENYRRMVGACAASARLCGIPGIPAGGSALPV